MLCHILCQTVLIETYWNVKTELETDVQMGHLVLIETYWNVKGETISLQTPPPYVLIETYWNVKTYVSDNIIAIFPCINRNILECKARNEERI